MPIVDPVFAQWLQDEGLWTVETNAAAVTQWGESAITGSRMSALALLADADAEAVRQRTFLAGPIVEEVHQLKGEWRGYIGSVITLTIDRLGYTAGKDVFVTGAEDDLSTGLSAVTVLRRL